LIRRTDRLLHAFGALVAFAGERAARGLGRHLLEPESRFTASAPTPTSTLTLAPAQAPPNPTASLPALTPAPAPTAATPSTTPASRAILSRALPAFFLRSHGRRLFRLLRVHLRCDSRARSEVLTVPVLSLVMLVLYSRPAAPDDPWLVPSIYGWGLFMSASTLIRSQHPESLWWLLSSPVDRTRFSLSTIPLLRLLILLPMSATVALISLRHPSPPGTTWALKLLSLLALVAYGDLVLLLGKVMFPEFPFSLPATGAGATTGRRFGSVMLGLPASGAGTAAILGFQHFGAPGIASGAVAALALHGPAYLWARRRARRAAEHLDLASLG
jgi:hypothetical protein